MCIYVYIMIYYDYRCTYIYIYLYNIHQPVLQQIGGFVPCLGKTVLDNSYQNWVSLNQQSRRFNQQWVYISG